MKISYNKDVSFNIPHISSLGIDPPEGKELSDFVCWMGFEDKDEPYLSSQNIKYRFNSSFTIPLSGIIDARIFPQDIVFELSNIAYTLNMYACWDKYYWEDDLSGNAIINQTSNPYITQANSDRPKIKQCDKYGFFDLNLNVYKNNDKNNFFVPNYNIKYTIKTVSGRKLNNIYLNGQLFAGKDVTEEYWNLHREDLYKGIDPELSVNHIWEDGIVNDSKQFIYPITSCHVSSDNIMHISCDAELLSGEYTVYSSYDEAKDKMTDNGSRGFFE